MPLPEGLSFDRPGDLPEGLSFAAPQGNGADELPAGLSATPPDFSDVKGGSSTATQFQQQAVARRDALAAGGGIPENAGPPTPMEDLQKRAQANWNTPLVPLKKLTEPVSRFLARPDVEAAGAYPGIPDMRAVRTGVNTAGSLAEGLTTPTNIAGIAAPNLGAAMAIHGVTQIPEQVGNIVEAAQSGHPEEIVEQHGPALLGNVGMSALMAVHAARAHLAKEGVHATDVEVQNAADELAGKGGPGAEAGRGGETGIPGEGNALPQELTVPADVKAAIAAEGNPREVGGQGEGQPTGSVQELEPQGPQSLRDESGPQLEPRGATAVPEAPEDTVPGGADAAAGQVPVGERPIVGSVPMRGAKSLGAGAPADLDAPGLLDRLKGALVPDRPAQPSRFYSKRGALAEVNPIAIDRIRQLTEASPELAGFARRAASSRQVATVLGNEGWDAVAESLKGGQEELPTFRAALMENRLRGLEQRWSDWADDVQTQPVDELVKDATDGKYRTAVEAVDNNPQAFLKKGKKKLSHEDALDNILEAGDVRSLRVFLHDLFDTASKKVGQMDQSDFPEGFDAYTKTPEFQKALATYKDLFEGTLKEAHEENKGYVTGATGPLDTYYPLSRAPEPPSRFLGMRSPFQRPKPPNNQFATGLGEAYDPGLAPFQNTLERGLRANYRGGLLRGLENEGLLQPLRPGSQAPETMPYKGREFTATEVPTGTQGQRAATPEWVKDELKPLLENKDYSDSLLQKAMQKVTNIATLGLGETMFHGVNELGTLTGNTPYVKNSLAGKTIGNTPATKIFSSLDEAIRTKPAQFRDELLEMAKNGEMPERYGHVVSAWTKEGRAKAAETGAEKTYTLSPLLFGKEGMDIRGRLVMRRIAKEIAAAEGRVASPQELYEATSRMGVYNNRLQNRIISAIKGSGLQPFATAASTMLRNGLDAAFGTGKSFSNNPMTYRVAQQLSGGAIGLLATWAITSKLYRGVYPWQDPKSKFLQIPLNDDDRASDAARAVFGDDLKKDGYINVGFFSPLVGRGIRSTGGAGAYEGAVRGESASRIAVRASAGPVNALTHLVAGPPVHVGMVAATGTAPYFVPNDKGTGLTPMDVTRLPKKAPGQSDASRFGQTALARGKAFAGSANPMLGAFEKGEQDKVSILGTIIQIAFPGLFKGPYSRPSQSTLRRNRQ